MSAAARLLIAENLTMVMVGLARGPGDNPQQFFDVLRAMLFYIDDVS